ncbi:MAG TPA: hypothetical protein VGQ76_04545 [Thermoanaerobaculia bacterium]|jgi:hypothetical protein|nr:hypothetical protein [Thermoanaerobaculia bacterium]
MADLAKPNQANVPDAKYAASALKITKPVVSRPERCCVHQFWAVVETDGTLVRGRNVVRSARLGPGQYEVIFTADVSGGAFLATIGRQQFATEPSGQIGVALRCCLPPTEANKGVWVDTHDSTGAFSDRAFHVVAFTD